MMEKGKKVNFQIQYFPLDEKEKIDNFAKQNNLSRRKLLELLFSDLSKLQDFVNQCLQN